MSYFFTKFVKLDPDLHGSAFILTPGSGSAKNECGSTALIQISIFYWILAFNRVAKFPGSNPASPTIILGPCSIISQGRGGDPHLRPQTYFDDLILIYLSFPNEKNLKKLLNYLTFLKSFRFVAAIGSPSRWNGETWRRSRQKWGGSATHWYQRGKI